MSIILLTGFEPFGKSQSNPSQSITERLHGEVIGGAQVVGLTLPVVMGADFERVAAAIDITLPYLTLPYISAKGT